VDLALEAPLRNSITSPLRDNNKMDQGNYKFQATRILQDSHNTTYCTQPTTAIMGVNKIHLLLKIVYLKIKKQVSKFS